MLRTEISEALKDSMRAKEERATSTLRLILAALKDRDIAARGKGKDEPVGDDELILLLQSMIKQRHDSITAYTKGGR
ncbi:MAG: GatB/YqeY domain-containing protein, partial [Rhodospirillaceae bacterium]|nr:GatB/YqeY domain-containing protein [Rhodospirillaceae bacterium]